jgi:hypothetical protein
MFIRPLGRLPSPQPKLAFSGQSNPFFAVRVRVHGAYVYYSAPQVPQFVPERSSPERPSHARQQSETRFTEDLPREMLHDKHRPSLQKEPSPSPSLLQGYEVRAPRHYGHERHLSTPQPLASPSPSPTPASKRPHHTSHQRALSTPMSQLDYDERATPSPRDSPYRGDHEMAARPRNPTPLRAHQAPGMGAPSKDYGPVAGDESRRPVRPGMGPRKSELEREFEGLMVRSKPCVMRTRVKPPCRTRCNFHPVSGTRCSHWIFL